jgi:natural product biosynthesis luciferase-like monooxygenase protein
MNIAERSRAYWRRQLSEPPPLPILPWNGERPPVPSFVRDTFSTNLSPETWRSIKEFAARADTTTQLALLSALAALLFRYTGQVDLVVGTLLDAGFGPLSHDLVALRTRLENQTTADDLVHQVAGAAREARQHWMPLSAVLAALDRAPGARLEGLFNVALIYSGPGNGPGRSARRVESTRSEHLMNCTLVLCACETDEGLQLHWEFDAELLELDNVTRMAGHFANLLAGMTGEPRLALSRLDFLNSDELQQLLVGWNATETKIPQQCIHQLIESQARQTPAAVAVVCRNRQLTYAELNSRANQLASYLCRLGVGPEVLVGICADRSLEMLVGLLGILKAGGAYVPLDPVYPAERIAFMLEDSQVKVLLTQEHLIPTLPPGGGTRVCLDADWSVIASEPATNAERGVSVHHLAYVLYTSGSTGKPKGVMIEHRNVVNFFSGMDARIRRGHNSVWLAVTSPSFDISVLELFWTLARGLTVVLHAGDEPARRPAAAVGLQPGRSGMEFSLFYFSSDQSNGPGGAYRLLIEGAKFADEHGFSAVWTPERHFHEFGALFPNPSVTSAALAMITRRVQIRSGSVVSPLHSAIRIAEEWSVVDNLSNGRVAISFASGWMPEDFTVNPVNYPERKEIMFRQIELVRRLWRGERVALPGPLGKDVPIKIYPRPVQKELPLWLTAAGNPETFEAAGRLGINLLTHLLGQSIEEVSRKVGLYRKAWREAGHPGQGHVTLMLHTFVGESMESVKATVRAPLIEYLRQSADLIKSYTWAFSAFKNGAQSRESVDFSALSKEEMDAILEHAFDRYFESSGLFGTPESCASIIENLRANDIDEVACLIDFGVNVDTVLEHLKDLDLLRRAVGSATETDPDDYSIPALIERHRVTHLQCTPSLAGMLILDERTQAAFRHLQTLMLGGEAFPVALARQLKEITTADILNMYGPTETTIWSTTYLLPERVESVPVGRPIANTLVYILDQHLSLVPLGIAGELVIGGAGVARGYLGRPEPTAERFIRNPFREDDPYRVYRTGDLARYLPDGNIEILGRLDHQVKIRGHRVELEEIEALLNEHPFVRESVVVARNGASQDKRLVAYVIPRNGQQVTQRQLREYARERMPEHMVPAQVVLMTAFPQTPNNKTDRNALPAPAIGTVEIEPRFEPPSSAAEESLAALWSELLGLERVGRHDDFFECGGHSLLAVQLIRRVRVQFGIDLPLKNLFEHPTIAGLAKAIDALTWSAAEPPSPPVEGEREEVEV